MGNSNKKNEILYNKVLENKISSILKNEYTSHDEFKDIKKFLKKKKNEDLIRSNFKDKFLLKDKGITTVKNLIDLIYQLNPNLKRNKKRNKPRKNLLFEDDSNEEDDEEEENEDEEDKVGDEDENENESKNTNNEIENEEEDEQDYNNNSNSNNNNDNINQKNNYFSDIQHNESDSLNSLNYMNNITQKDDVFNLKSSNNYGGTKQLNESKRKSYNNNNNHSIQSTSTFRKTEQGIKTTKQIKSIPIKKKPQNHKIVKIDIAEMKKHCLLQEVKDTYLRKTEVNTRPHFSTMDPIEKEVYELTMKKTHKEPKLGDDNFLSMVDILTQPNKKREDRIHSRSPIRRSNYQTATSTYDNNNTNTFMQKNKYQNTHYNKYNETQNKNQKRK